MPKSNQKVVVITGATSGIGLAVSLLLAKEGYAIFAVGSREDRCLQAKETILSKVPDADISFFHANLSNQGEVHQLALDMISALVRKNGGVLYGLINNAGGVRDHYFSTEDGIEYTFALNHLSGFLLTYLLRAYLKNGVLLFTSSYAHKSIRLHWNDLMFQHFFNVLLCYKQSKLANLMMARELKDRLSKDGIRVFAIDPGLVKTDIGDKGTKGIALFFWRLIKRKGVSPDIPAKTYSFLLKYSDTPGLYFKECKSIGYNPQVDRADQRKRLFVLSEKLCKIQFDIPQPFTY